MNKDMILAMRKRYLDLLLSGEKKAEVRSTCPRGLGGYTPRLYLYYRGCIYGHVDAYSLWFTGYGRCEEFVERLHKEACLTKEEMLDYLKDKRGGVIYRVSNPVRYAEPISVPCRPQGWIYMKPNVRALLPDGKEEK